MLAPAAALAGLGLGSSAALIAGGRFSGASRWVAIGHISPPRPRRAAAGGLAEEGDLIGIPKSRLGLFGGREGYPS